jgi:chromosome segregation ATPase
MSAKNVIIKRKIANDIYELMPKTTGEQVTVTYGATVQSLATTLATVYTDLESWNNFKASVDFAGTDSALDTLREIIDYLSKEDVATSVAGRLKELGDSLDTLSGTVETLTGRVDTNEADIKTNKEAIAANKDALDALTGRVDTAETDIKTNADAIEELKTATGARARVLFIDVESQIPDDVTESDLLFQEV